MTDTTDVVQRARQALDGITERGIAWETRTEHRELARVVHSGEWEGSLSRCCDCGTEAGYPNLADAELIAAAPTLISDLLGLVEVALPTITAQRDDALAQVAKLRREVGAARDDLRRSDSGKLRAEVDRLRATIARVRDALGNHPRCDVHPDDLITCGWKRAVADVQAALDGEAQ